MINTLSFLLEEAGIFIKDMQKTKLVAYIDKLNKWNRVHNFTSIRNPNKMLVYHIIDSIIVAPYMDGHTFIDVGTGPGLPGIPLSIMLPNKHFTLLDSIDKRVRFLRQVQYELDLKNITSIHSRLEVFLPKTPFDGVISRAFASLHDMAIWCKKLIDRNGYFYALKGRLLNEEIIQLSKEFRIETIIKLQVPNLNADRHLITIKMN